MRIVITKDLLNKLPHFDIVAYTMDVDVEQGQNTYKKIIEYEQFIKEEYSLEDILNIPLIKEARDGYKRLGKDPSRYRLAVESLLRRLVKGFGLTSISNVVDVGNLLSIRLLRSTAILDAKKIIGDIKIRIGNSCDKYEGIGRGRLNVTNIPVYEDEVSPFGSTTSDTLRTAISEDSTTILVMVICFDTPLSYDEKQIIQTMYQEFAKASNIKEVPVIKEERK